ncbi:PTS sugar transporter subunit IIA [Mycoplasma sp. SG1]|uniref:PTS sugar transporter subunit IIA n=1 Tax=Mycoplasma sp. SG1 TaxID=2810348 RepID=UPI00202400E8|nr:PTS glucose transporter subunit IIA [Mycoplasma sp. SG1]URM53012.1 PTS glucose transporter subunit IIA [Mycoplasma sp. SG1]
MCIKKIISFFKKSSSVVVYSPCDGEIKDIANIEDEVFSKNVLGRGVYITPEIGEFHAMVNGKLVNVFPLGHYYCIKTSDTGYEVVLHIGIDSVNVSGSCFSKKVEQDDEVEQGSLLVEVNIDELGKKAKSLDSPIIVTNESLKNAQITDIKYGKVKTGDPIFTIVKKS